MSTAKIERAKRGIERLTTLRNVMRRAKSIEGGHVIPVGGGRIVFDIGIWAVNADELYASDEVARMELKPVGVRGESACGTAACVAGTAGLIPEFRDLGLKTSKLNGIVAFKGEVNPVSAFSEFFGLDSQQAHKITIPSFYTNLVLTVDSDGVEVEGDIKPKHVLTRLDEVIAVKTADLRSAQAKRLRLRSEAKVA